MFHQHSIVTKQHPSAIMQYVSLIPLLPDGSFPLMWCPSPQEKGKVAAP